MQQHPWPLGQHLAPCMPSRWCCGPSMNAPSHTGFSSSVTLLGFPWGPGLVTQHRAHPVLGEDLVSLAAGQCEVLPAWGLKILWSHRQPGAGWTLSPPCWLGHQAHALSQSDMLPLHARNIAVLMGSALASFLSFFLPVNLPYFSTWQALGTLGPSRHKGPGEHQGQLLCCQSGQEPLTSELPLAL